MSLPFPADERIGGSTVAEVLRRACHATDPWGAHRAVFTAAGTLNREDWGLTRNVPLDGGGLLVSREIRIEIELEAVLQPCTAQRDLRRPRPEPAEPSANMQQTWS
jgi:hypothetical protein